MVGNKRTEVMVDACIGYKKNPAIVLRERCDCPIAIAELRDKQRIGLHCVTVLM